ncbi:hypothetical protein E2320_002012 [Naja naja]|nr:hypothetical protein E2320_002012 [Naja naja]
MKGLHKEIKNMGLIIIDLGSEKESKLQHKTCNFRKRIKPIWPEQKQNKSQRVKGTITEKHGTSVIIDLGSEKAPENLQKSHSCTHN